MYICGGFNVYPAEIEQVLARLDGVAEAAVIGVPDERLGEVGKAFVVVKPGAELDEETVIAYTREHLANFKAPRSVDVPRRPAAQPRRQSGQTATARDDLMDLTFDDATEEFRAEVRDFLAANTAHFPTKSYDTAEGFEQHRALGQGAFRRGPVGDRVAGEVRRPRRHAAAVDRLRGGVLPRGGARPGQRQRHLDARRRRCSRTAPRNSSTGCCRRWPAARRSGRRPGRSRSRAATSRRCARPPRRTDGGWKLNGQKIWSSRAPFGERAFGLFRSDPEAQRHKGLTYFMFDLKADGVTVRPDRPTRR